MNTNKYKCSIERLETLSCTSSKIEYLKLYAFKGAKEL